MTTAEANSVVLDHFQSSLIKYLIKRTSAAKENTSRIRPSPVCCSKMFFTPFSYCSFFKLIDGVGKASSKISSHLLNIGMVLYCWTIKQDVKQNLMPKDHLVSHRLCQPLSNKTRLRFTMPEIPKLEVNLKEWKK